MAKTKDNRTYAEHRKALEQALRTLPPLTVVEGGEGFLRSAALRRLTDAFQEHFPDAEETVLYGGGDVKFDFSVLLNALTVSNLFAAQKIVIVRNAQKELFPEKMGTEGKSNPWQKLADYLNDPAPETYCIIEVEKINAARTLGKALNRGLVIPCPLLAGAGDVHAWLRARAEELGKKLDRTAADLLHTCHGNNLAALAGELEKLSIFTGEERDITLETVRTFMPENEEFNAFELVNALEIRNRQRALHFARLITRQGSRDQGGKLLSGETSAHIAVAVISARMENLLRMRIALNGGESAASVAERLRLPPWQGQKLGDAARNFSVTELTRILNVIAAELQAAHDTGADIALSLEKIVLAVCPRENP